MFVLYSMVFNLAGSIPSTSKRNVLFYSKPSGDVPLAVLEPSVS